jgi:hypothetical protein
MVKTIRDNMITQIESILGSGYSKLSFASDLSMNKFGKSLKRFAVTPESAQEVSGSTGVNTMDHRFVITLTDGYNVGAASQLSDDAKMERIGELQGKALEIYKMLQVNKTLLSPRVLIVNSLNISTAEFLDEEKVAVIKFDINVKYKII